MMLLKCCTQFASKFEKFSSGHRSGKGQLPFQSQRRAMPENVQTAVLLCSFHMLVRSCSKSFKQYVNQELPDVQFGFKKGSRTRDQIADIHWIMEKAEEFQKNRYILLLH